MAITAAIPSDLPVWQIDYQNVLREYGVSFIDIKLSRAISSCMDCLMTLPGDDFDFSEHRACLVALSDLLILRTLQYRYQARQHISDNRMLEGM
jgi:hypothetical protein